MRRSTSLFLQVSTRPSALQILKARTIDPESMPSRMDTFLSYYGSLCATGTASRSLLGGTMHLHSMVLQVYWPPAICPGQKAELCVPFASWELISHKLISTYCCLPSRQGEYSAATKTLAVPSSPRSPFSSAEWRPILAAPSRPPGSYLRPPWPTATATNCPRLLGPSYQTTGMTSTSHHPACSDVLMSTTNKHMD